MLEKPIFVVGVGRSGSSIFHRIFSEHPNVVWLSLLCDRHPERPAWNRSLMRLIDYPVVGPLLKRRYEPAEGYQFWDHCYGGFSQSCRDLVADDVTPLNKNTIHDVMSRVITGKRHRLLFKITGWPRIGFLREVFPDARFIHIYRDGRAVANSLLDVPFWLGWRGAENWRWGPLSSAQQQEWEQHGKSFVALVAIQWKLLMEAMEKARQGLPPGSFTEIRYEDFADRPLQIIKEMTRFCDLDWSDKFERRIAGFNLRSTNDKWKSGLSGKQQDILEAVMGETLKRYGYRLRCESSHTC